ncbi:MAG: PAS domain S-box protein, partial [Gemmatimonadetes bacterium]|nr:PAS domain S-box protein [Gemmatimonadota bacterium]
MAITPAPGFPDLPGGAAELWQTLVRQLPDHVLVVDPAGRIQFINRTLPELTLDQVVGTHVLEWVPREYHDAVRQAFDEVFTGGTSVTHEIPSRGPGGTEAWYYSRVLPVTREGVVVAAIVVATDVTETRRAQRAMRQQYRDTVEYAPVGICRTTREGRFLMVNQRLVEMLGYHSVEDLLRVDLEAGVYVRAADRAALVARYEGERAPFPVEVQWKRKDGTSLWVQMTTRTITDEAGTPLHFESFVLDVTERKAVEERFLKAFHGSPVAMSITRL